MSCCYGSAPNDTGIPPVKKTTKIVILGNSAVGKTTLIHRLTVPDDEQYILQTQALTVGTAYVSMKLGGVECNVWDTAGQEKYRSIASFYIRDADVCVIAYSLVDSKSKDDLPVWEDLMSKHAPNAIKITIATMHDLCKDSCSNYACTDDHEIVVSSLSGRGISKLRSALGVAAKSKIDSRSQ